MKSASKVTLWDDRGNKFFGEGPCRLLRGVQKYGSLRAAAAAMEMAYPKAMKLLKNAEAALGFPLTVRVTGGKDGGGSTLTPEAIRFLAKYEAWRDSCIAENERLFRAHFPKTGCVVMASGLGKRFGGNKLLADFDGEPMILKSLYATDTLFSRRIVVTRHPEVAALCRERDVEVLLHDSPHRSDTVRLGLEALGDVDCCLFCPGDQPLLSRHTVARLLESWEADREAIWRPCYDGQAGSPVLFPRWALPELLSLPEGKGGSWLIRCHPEALRCLPLADPWELADADTPEELELLKNHDSKK